MNPSFDYMNLHLQRLKRYKETPRLSPESFEDPQQAVDYHLLSTPQGLPLDLDEITRFKWVGEVRNTAGNIMLQIYHVFQPNYKGPIPDELAGTEYNQVLVADWYGCNYRYC